MKHQPIIKKILIFFAAVAILWGGLLWYAYWHPQGSEPAAPVPVVININCLQSPEYFVIDRNPGQPGLDVVIRHKTSADEAFPCVAATAVATSSDTVIKNDLPQFVIGLTDRFLIVDSGTAPPPRGLIIYNLDVQTSTFTDSYSPPVAIATNTITYWEATKQPVTTANCPDLGQYRAGGLGAVIESYVTIDLTTLTRKELGAYRCDPTQ